MMRNKVNAITCAVACVVGSTLSGAVLLVDQETRNSMFLENFSSGDPSTQLKNGITFDSASGGVASYRVPAKIDPQLFFDGYTGGISFSEFPNVRIRHKFSAQLREGSVYPLPVRAEQFAKLDVNDSLSARQVTLEEYPLQGEGIRIDPIDGPPMAGIYSIDYIMLDRGRTLGFEFDQVNSTRGGKNNFFIGTNLGGQNGKEILRGVDNGLLVGNPANADPMLILHITQSTGLTSIDTSIYKYVEIRMRFPEPNNGVATVFFRSKPGKVDPNKINIYLVNDPYFHTYLLDLSEDPDWTAGALTNFRFNPTDQKQTFEIDYIRFYEKVKLD
ncbi:MAG: hypothetical protein ACN4GF_03845 [Lentimonas sp.]